MAQEERGWRGPDPEAGVIFAASRMIRAGSEPSGTPLSLSTKIQGYVTQSCLFL